MKNEIYLEEFKVSQTGFLNTNDEIGLKKELNKNVYEFRKENPDYDVFNLHFIKTGVTQVYIIITWRKIQI
ncbi:MAG: hypothetical protein ACFE8V_12100 [Promethearchaeota archaeon]